MQTATLIAFSTSVC